MNGGIMDIKLEDGEHNLYACKNYIMRVGTVPVIILDVRDQLVEYAVMCEYTVAAGLVTYKKGTIFIRPIAEAGLASITAEEYEKRLTIYQNQQAVQAFQSANVTQSQINNMKGQQ